jgi:hypothetical protein
MYFSIMEEHGEEIKLFLEQTKLVARPYLPLACFVIGIITTYAALRHIPGYDESCTEINEKLHAPRSVMELLEYKPFPGAFPFMPSQRLIDDFKDLLSTKDVEIASLNKRLAQEDDELAKVLSGRDIEIENLMTTVEKKEEEINYYKEYDNFAIYRRKHRIPIHPLHAAQIRQLEEELQAALTNKAELEQKIEECREQAKDAAGEEGRRNAGAAEPEMRSSYLWELGRPWRALHDQESQRPLEAADFRTQLQAQLSQRGLDVAKARQSVAAEYEQQVRSLESQLSQEKLDHAKTQKSAVQREKRLRKLEAKLAQPDRDTVNIRQIVSVEYDQRVNDLESQLSQQKLEHEEDRQKSTVQQERELNELKATLAQREIDAANTRQAVSAEYDQRVNDLKTQHDQRVNDLESRLSQQKLDSANTQNSTVQQEQQLNELEAKIAQRDLDAANIRQTVSAEYDQRIRELEAQSSQNKRNHETSQQMIVHREQQLRELEAKLAQRDPDAANVRQTYDERIRELEALSSQYKRDHETSQQVIVERDQRVAKLELEAQFSRRSLDDANTQQSSLQLVQQITSLQTQLSERDRVLANAQDAYDILQNKANQMQDEYVNLDYNHEALKKLYSEKIEKANNLYFQFEALRKTHEALEVTHQECQLASKSQGQVNISIAELNAARQQAADLAKSNEEIRRLREQLSPSKLWQTRLEEKEQALAKAQKHAEMLQNNVNSVLQKSEVSSEFRDFHEAVVNARNHWHAKARNLEAKLYPLQIRAANLQARDTRLTYEVEQYRNTGGRRQALASAPAPAPVPEQQAHSELFRELQDERDRALQEYAEGLAKLKTALRHQEATSSSSMMPSANALGKRQAYEPEGEEVVESGREMKRQHQ